MGCLIALAPLVTSKDIADGAVTAQPRKFSANKSAMRSARMFFYFRTADIAVGMPHPLGKNPTSWRVVSISRAGGAPGVVYAPIQGNGAGTKTTSQGIHTLGRNYLVLACSTANTYAEIELT